MTVTMDSKLVVERYVAALANGDERTVRELFATGATWTLAASDLPTSGTWKGRDAILGEFLAVALAGYAPGSLELDVHGLIAEDDQVALQWTTRALTRDGRRYENECIGVFTIRDGRIQSVREYMDTLYAHDTVFAR